MADDFDIDAVIAEHGGRFVPGKSTKRTIAAPETGPGTTIPADDFDVDALATDAGPTARRAASGGFPKPAVAPDDVTGLDTRDVERAARLQRDTDNNPFAGDPLARLIATGLVGGGAGSLAGAGAAAAGLPAIVSRAVAGAAGGAANAAGQGDSIVAGAATGAAIPFVSDLAKVMKGATGSAGQQLYRRIGAALGEKSRGELTKLGEQRLTETLQKHGAADLADPNAPAALEAAKAMVEGELKAAQAASLENEAATKAANAAAAEAALPPEERLFRQAGQLVGKAERAKVAALGKDTVAGALDRAGVKALDNPQQAAAAIHAARAGVGKNIGSAYDTFDATGAQAKVGDALNALDTYRGELEASTATKPLATAVRKFMKDFAETHGTGADATISLKQLNQEIGALEKNGFSAPGTELSQSSSAQLGRGAAKALNGLLDKQIAQAAKANPAAAEAAKNLATWNKDFRVLKTLERPIADRAAALRFAPPAAPPPLPTPVADIKLDLDRLAKTHGPLVDEYRALRLTSDALSKEAGNRAFGPSGISKLGNTPAQVATTLAGKAAALPFRAAALPFSLADAAVAQLFRAKASGTVTPQLLQAASAAGVSADVLRHFVAHAGQPTMSAP